MTKNQAGQSIGAEMLSKTTGDDFTGAVTVYVTGDAGTQAIGSVGGGICTHEGNGYHTYRPSADETNYDLVAFTFKGAGALSQTIQVETITIAQISSMASSNTAAADSFSATDLVTRTLRLLNVIPMTQSVPEPEDLANGLAVLSELVESWAPQRKLIYYVAANRQPLVSGTASYTIGVGGAFNQVRPITIPRFSVILDRTAASLIEIPFGRPLTLEEWQRIPMKSTQGSFPRSIYYDRSWTQGLANLYVYPVPDNSLCDLVLYTPTPLAGFADATSLYTFPPGYKRALRYALAVDLSDDYPGSLTDKIEKKAIDAVAWLKRANFTIKEAQFDRALAGGRGNATYDIYSDT